MDSVWLPLLPNPEELNSGNDAVNLRVLHVSKALSVLLNLQWEFNWGNWTYLCLKLQWSDRQLLNWKGSI